MPRPSDPYCPVARALNVVGERWSLLVLRDLVLHGPRRFQDLQRSLAGISPNTLSARLKTLEDAGVIERRFYDQHPPRAEYVLTEKGEALRPVVRALREWGERYAPRRASV
jgi:DNA-binding HxlR family transcriptional regulator